MTDDEFKKNALYLLNKYVKDEAAKKEIKSLIEGRGSDAAKGILHDICEKSGDIEAEDSKIIKDIAFNFI